MSRLTSNEIQKFALLEDEYQNSVFIYNRMPFTSSMNGQSIFNRPLRSPELTALRNKADQDDLARLNLYKDQTRYTKSQLVAYVDQMQEYIKNPSQLVPMIPGGARAKIGMYDPNKLNKIRQYQEEHLLRTTDISVLYRDKPGCTIS